jgi:hypothetical protein
MFREIITVYSENYMKHILNTFHREDVEIFKYVMQVMCIVTTEF